MNRQRNGSATIGVYDGEYCGSFHIELALTCMRLPYEVFGDEDVLGSRFGEAFSVLIFGAGHVFDSPTALGGAVGKQRIGDLIGEGRNYIGICAGAYLALLDGPKGLALARHELYHPQAGNIFQGFLSVEHPDGSGREFPLWYQNGPVLSRATHGVVARFSTKQAHEADTCSKGASLTASDFSDRPAAVATEYGNGRCVLLSAHPELGALGIPGYISLTEHWMQENFPEERQAHPNRVPVGRSRRCFLDNVGELGLSAQVRGPQWSMLRELIGGALEEPDETI